MRFIKRARLNGKLCKFLEDLKANRISTRGEAYSQLLDMLAEAEELEDYSFSVIQRLITII